MNSNFELINSLIFIISFASIWFANLIYSPVHKHLRNKRVYCSLLVFAIFMLVISANLIDSTWENHEKTNAISPMILMSYLLFYKVADLIAIKKHNRNIYFRCRLSDMLKDEEAAESTIL